jgi:hypothetical protein
MRTRRDAENYLARLAAAGSKIDQALGLTRDRALQGTVTASPFQPVRSMQRAVLMRLREGPLLFISFCGAATQPGQEDMLITDASGKQRPAAGLYAALSFDEGETWPTRRLVSDDGPPREVETTDRRTFTMSKSSAETFGYLAVTQAANGIIHLISSKNHYAFNLAWLRTPPSALP